MIVLAYHVAVQLHASQPDCWKPALAIHIFGWAAQFFGHFAYEGRAPAVFESLFQAIFTAPLFVIMEVMFELGYKKKFQEEMKVVVGKKLLELKKK